MPATAPITVWHWAGFVAVIVLFLVVDLKVFHRSSHVIKPREALLWSSIWILLAMVFAGGLALWRGPGDSLEFVTGYLVEFTLSMDNVFAIALIFSYFAVPPIYQHRVLHWGILGALVMRGMMIGVGAALILTFHWLLYLLGGFLIYTGIKWGVSKQEVVQPEKNRIVRLARKIFPVSSGFENEKFVSWKTGQMVLTPLMLVLLIVETTDLIFAVDSVPAIFAVTQKPFIVFTSNIFAILGLRSLYFVLAGAIQYFRFLKGGLAAVLVFIGLKMLIAPWQKVPTLFSLLIVAAIITFSIALSIIAARRETQKKRTEEIS